MSDYLNNLTKRSLNQAEVIQPRLASMFEPLRSNLGLDATTNLSLEQPSVNENQMPLSMDIGNGDSLGLKPQEGVRNRGRFQESEIDMETQKVLSVRGEEVTMKPDWKVLGEEADNQRFSVTAQTHGETTFSVANKSSREPVLPTHPETRTLPNVNPHNAVTPPHSQVIKQTNLARPIVDRKSERSPNSLELESVDYKSGKFEHTSGDWESVDLSTPKFNQQINAMFSSKFTEAVQAIAGIAQPREELSVEHSEQFQPGEVSTDVLLSKPSKSNIDNLIPLSTKPAITVHPPMRASTSTNTTFSEPPPPTPTINVTIGRIEVRATSPTSTPTKQRPKPPVMGLEEYLHQRAKGDHQ